MKPPSRTQLATATGSRSSGNAMSSTAVTDRFSSVSGMRIFQQKLMSWSMRSLGRVARIHMNTRMSAYTFRVNQKTPRSGTASTPGPCQPPSHSVVRIEQTTVTLPYSESASMVPQRIPEYSVSQPATSSDSASGRSNGVRFVSASAAMK